MAKRTSPHTTTLTPVRAARLYKLLALIAETARTRPAVLKKLRVDLRGFYRDLEFLRSRDIEIGSDGDRYFLVGRLEDALARLPFPDPGLSLQEALLLSQGRTTAHRKLRTRIDHFIGSNGTPAPAV